MGNHQSAEEGPNASEHAVDGRHSPATNFQQARGQQSRKGSAHDGSFSAAAKPHVPLPPTTTLVSSSIAVSPSTSTTHAHATVSASPQRSSHGRGRSLTTSSALPDASILASKSDPIALPKSDPTAFGAASLRAAVIPSPPEQRKSPPTEIQPTKTVSPVSVPMDVPQSAEMEAKAAAAAAAATSEYMESPYSHPPSNYNRPPRLPLPIEEEDYTPGSPIITPQDVAVASLEQVDIGELPRRTSVLSHTTVEEDDDDDDGDNDAFAAESSKSLGVRVPTRLEWNGSGDKVFVTGTFCSWEKKMKLHKNKDAPGFSATVMLPPGTHHIKFLVDGEMLTSNDLPTTVDWINILVNYIEIVAPLPTPDETPHTPLPSEPLPIPGAALTAGQITETSRDTVSNPNTTTQTEVTTPVPIPEPSTHPSTLDALPATPSVPIPVSRNRAPDTSYPSSQYDPQQQHRPRPSAPPSRTHLHQPDSHADHLKSTATTPGPSAPPTPKKHLPAPVYTNQIPQFLIDLDHYQQPEDERFQRAQRVATVLPQPPSLPMFLNKSILNGVTPHKDDASVLNMPNHTVLNHLATSSIKNGVLATSGTTRYKRKFLTTIMYKPTSND